MLQLVPADADIGEAWRWTIGDSAHEWESGVGATAADAILKATRLEAARAEALGAVSAAVGVAPEDAHLGAMTAVRIAGEANCTCSRPPTRPMWRSVRLRAPDPDSGVHIYTDREVRSGAADDVLAEPALVVVQTHPEICPALAELHGSPRVVRVEEGQPPIVVVILRDGEALDLS